MCVTEQRPAPLLDLAGARSLALRAPRTSALQIRTAARAHWLHSGATSAAVADALVLPMGESERRCVCPNCVRASSKPRLWKHEEQHRAEHPASRGSTDREARRERETETEMIAQNSSHHRRHTAEALRKQTRTSVRLSACASLRELCSLQSVRLRVWHALLAGTMRLRRPHEALRQDSYLLLLLIHRQLVSQSVGQHGARLLRSVRRLAGPVRPSLGQLRVAKSARRKLCGSRANEYCALRRRAHIQIRIATSNTRRHAHEQPRPSETKRGAGAGQLVSDRKWASCSVFCACVYLSVCVKLIATPTGWLTTERLEILLATVVT